MNKDALSRSPEAAFVLLIALLIVLGFIPRCVESAPVDGDIPAIKLGSKWRFDKERIASGPDGGVTDIAHQFSSKRWSSADSISGAVEDTMYNT